ncbi:DUF4157 domain-containing protein, partial [Solirubrobacter ginsenosidimutans]
MERELLQRAAQTPRGESVRRAALPMGVRAVLALQGAAGNRAVSHVLHRTPAFALATSGRASEVPRRAEMERAFGTGFGDVRAHLGGAEATAGLGALGARAAASRATIAFKEADPPADVVAHELAHVVQQRRRASGAAGAEAAAERAASAV